MDALGCWDVTFGGGLRDAAVHIDRVNILIPGPIRVIPAKLNSEQPLRWHRPHGVHRVSSTIRLRGLAFVGNVRGSLLYGTKSMQATSAYKYTNETPETYNYDQTAKGCMGVAELSLGMEWSRQISCNTTFFARGMWENQYWANTATPAACPAIAWA